jgi:hypothetical protein
MLEQDELVRPEQRTLVLRSTNIRSKQRKSKMKKGIV